MVKGKGIVISALIIGATSYLSKKENRDNAMKVLSNVKTQVTNLLSGQQQNKESFDIKGTSFTDIAETSADPATLKINENEFISEGGGQTMLAYYNESDQPHVN